MELKAPATTASNAAKTWILPNDTGTAGQILKHSSTAGTLEWGGGQVLITNASSNSTVSNITHDSLDTDVYKGFHLMGHFIPTTDDIALNFYWRDGGSDCVADEYAIGQLLAYPSDNTAENAAQDQGRMQLCGNAGNAAREGWKINLFMFPDRNGDASGQNNVCFWHGNYRSNGHDFRSLFGNGDYDTDVYPDGFKLQPHSGQIGEYSYALYGLTR